MRRLRWFTWIVASLPLACRSVESPPPVEAARPVPAAPSAASQPAMPILSAPAAPPGASASAAETAKPAPDSREGRVEAVAAEYRTLREAYEANFRGVKSQEEFEEILRRVPQPDYAPLHARAWAIVDEDPADEAAFRALAWLIDNDSLNERVADELAKHHMAREGMGDLCRSLLDGQAGHEQMVRELSRTSPHASVRGLATFALAEKLQERIALVQEAKNARSPKAVAELESYVGQGRVQSLRATDDEELRRQAIEMLRIVLRDHADVKLRRGTLGDVARGQLFELEHLSVGQVAPEITGEDVAGLPMKLTDFRGKVVLLDFWGNW